MTEAGHDPDFAQILSSSAVCHADPAEQHSSKRNAEPNNPPIPHE
jgi:hypothetical protein